MGEKIMSTDRDFIAITDGNDKNACVNLSLVRLATFDEMGCHLHFTESHKVTIGGLGGLAMMDRISDRTLALNGEPIKLRTLDEALKKAKDSEST